MGNNQTTEPREIKNHWCLVVKLPHDVTYNMTSSMNIYKRTGKENVYAYFSVDNETNMLLFKNVDTSEKNRDFITYHTDDIFYQNIEGRESEGIFSGSDGDIYYLSAAVEEIISSFKEDRIMEPSFESIIEIIISPTMRYIVGNSWENILKITGPIKPNGNEQTSISFEINTKNAMMYTVNGTEKVFSGKDGDIDTFNEIATSLIKSCEIISQLGDDSEEEDEEEVKKKQE